MAFAASDAHSFARASLDSLSVEYAFYHAFQRQPNPDRTTGVSYAAMTEAIATNGQPLESGWPYLADLQPHDPWTLPAIPVTVYRRNTKTIGKALKDIYDALGTGTPVVVVMEISNSFYYLTADAVLPALANEARVGIHAVLAVGFGDLNGAPCLLIRNSWGEGWGNEGYGWINEGYLAPRLLVAGVMN